MLDASISGFLTSLKSIYFDRFYCTFIKFLWLIYFIGQ